MGAREGGTGALQAPLMQASEGAMGAGCFFSSPLFGLFAFLEVFAPRAQKGGRTSKKAKQF